MNSNILFRTIIVISFLVLAASPASAEECTSKYEGVCHNKNEALKYKIIAIFSILITSMIGVTLPTFSRAVPALHPDRDLFVVVKAFASGVILATGYMHVLPDSFDDLTSECLPERPWHKFPFTTFVAMLSAVFTLMVDSFSISFFKKKISASITSASSGNHVEAAGGGGGETKELEQFGHGHGHGIGHANGHVKSVSAEQLLRYRVIAQVSYFIKHML